MLKEICYLPDRGINMILLNIFHVLCVGNSFKENTTLASKIVIY